jgi:hypothetical protein
MINSVLQARQSTPFNPLITYVVTSLTAKPPAVRYRTERKTTKSKFATSSIIIFVMSPPLTVSRLGAWIK